MRDYSLNLKIIFPLSFCLLLTSSCFQLIAPENSTSTGTKGCDVTALPFGTGSGTSSDPFQICTVAHLQNIQTNLSANYILMTDLDMTNFTYPQFLPIGLNIGAFTGVFNGNGFTIANWTATDSTVSLSLFNALDLNAVIENLKLSNFNISSGITAATLAVQLAGSVLIDHVTVAGSTVQGIGNGSIGGILGYSVVGATLNQSSYTGNIIQGNNGVAGGLIASASQVTVNHCSTHVTMTGAFIFAGGLIGIANGSVTLNYSDASGSISSPAVFTNGAGGLIAWTYGASSINHSHSSVSINLPATFYSYYGGLVGNSLGGINVSSSYSTGAITLGSGATMVGGLVGAGFNTISITDSYSTSPITIAGSSSYSVGGIIGCGGYNCSLQNVTTARVLSLGRLNVVGAGAIAGGLFNTPDGYPVAATFWDSTATGTNTDYASAGATGFTTASGTLFQQSTYAAAGWDFTSAWYPPTPGVYPTLR